MYCNKEIVMSDRTSGNWYPYNSDGTPHDCRNQAQISTGTKKVVTKTLSLEVLDARLRKVESFLFLAGAKQ
jgi:hypothetical protein